MTNAVLPKPPRGVYPNVRESIVQAKAEAILQHCGYTIYHTWLSIRSEAGFPDLWGGRPATERRPGRIVQVEVKALGGKISAPQAAWLELIRRAGGESYVFWAGHDQALADLLALDVAPDPLPPLELELPD